MEEPLVKFAKIYFIKEIIQMFRDSQSQGGSLGRSQDVKITNRQRIRTTGRIIYSSGEVDFITIEHEGAHLDVDISFVGRENLVLGCMFQFIGEINFGATIPTLNASIVRNVEDMDLVLYQKSVKLLREWIAK